MNIVMLPGTTVTEGGYLTGYITPVSQYCGVKAVTVPTTNTAGPGVANGQGGGGIRVYPNPAGDLLNVEITDPEFGGMVAVTVYDMTGRVVTEERSSTKKVTVFLQGQAPGIYLIRVNGGTRSAAARVIRK
jgi:hypothetical protein